jgi:hypothetical protein
MLRGAGDVCLVLFFLTSACVLLGPLVVRIFCETSILLFRTHETLVEIRDRLK